MARSLLEGSRTTSQLRTHAHAHARRARTRTARMRTRTRTQTHTQTRTCQHMSARISLSCVSTYLFLIVVVHTWCRMSSTVLSLETRNCSLRPMTRPSKCGKWKAGRSLKRLRATSRACAGLNLDPAGAESMFMYASQSRQDCGLLGVSQV